VVLKMFKNLIITILGIIILFLWITSDPDELTNDPDDVTIEYKCSVIREYIHVPPEVLHECRQRGKLDEPDLPDTPERQKVSRSFL
jgi:hypothetical protein